MIEYVAIFFSLLALIISLYTIIRDNNFRRLEMFLKQKDRLQNLLFIDDDISIEERIYLEENPETDEAYDYKLKSNHKQRRLDTEFDFTCLLYLKNKIDKKLFYEMFKNWLNVREMTNLYKVERTMNYPNTTKLIKKFNKNRNEIFSND